MRSGVGLRAAGIYELDYGGPGGVINPKDAIGSDKLPLHLVPAHVIAGESLALLDGALKYGRTNWRVTGVRASIYVDACKRHIEAWFEGREADPDSGLHDLWHAKACLTIILDAQAAGKLTDDRMVAGGHEAAMRAMTPHVARLKALHAKRTQPRHYTIVDNPHEGGHALAVSE